MRAEGALCDTVSDANIFYLRRCLEEFLCIETGVWALGVMKEQVKGGY